MLTFPRFIAFSSILLLTLVGCGTGISTSSSGGSAPVPLRGALLGRVHGGQQPLTAASIYLYAVSTAGYAQPAQSLLSGAGVSTDTNGKGYVATDSKGNFTITGDYSCPSSTSLVYLLAAGGNPGLTPGTNNASSMLGAALGNCAALKANAATTNINVDEATTVALAYALSGFMTSATNAGSSSTNLSGITNAFATAANLVDYTSGTSRLTTPAGNGVVPQAEINSLANILAPCVNSNGVVSGPPSSSACYALFMNATSNSVAPADTLQAILNIAHSPASNVNALAMLALPEAPFLPALTSSPNDWTLAITYTGGGINTPQSVAIDAVGNAWIANATNSIVELSPTSASFLSGANGFTPTGLDAPTALAMDTRGDIWIANCGDPCSGSGNASSVIRLSADGTTSSSFTSAGLRGSYAIASSGANAIWVANSLGSSLTELGADGSTAIASDQAVGLLYPVSVAVDLAGNVFTVSPASNAIIAFSANGSVDTTDSYDGTALSYPYAVAVDNSGRVWVANHGNNTVTILSGGKLVTPSPITGGGLTAPNAIAVDGAGNAWVVNSGSSVSEISSVGIVLSPSTGLRSDLQYPNSAAIDGSGNVWITSCGHYCRTDAPGTGSVMQVVGAATPVVTPLSAGEAGNSLSSRP